MESWLSGLRRTTGNRVWADTPPRVQIPNSPPELIWLEPRRYHRQPLRSVRTTSQGLFCVSKENSPRPPSRRPRKNPCTVPARNTQRPWLFLRAGRKRFSTARIGHSAAARQYSVCAGSELTIFVSGFPCSTLLPGMFYTPIPSIKPRSTHVNPKICVFSPFLAFFALERQNYPPPAEKTATEAHRRPNSPAAPSRPSALRPVACPVARPLGLAPLWARGRGVCSAPFGQLHPAVVPPACAPCSSLPSASDALLMRLYELSCADGKGGRLALAS